jgi:hypothetical protein
MGRTACTEPQCLYKGALYLTLFLVWALVRVFHILGRYSGVELYSLLVCWLAKQRSSAS